MSNFDDEKLKVPAYLRHKAIVKQGKQKLILTALDRKEAHLPPNSTRATARPPATTQRRIVSPERSRERTPRSTIESSHSAGARKNLRSSLFSSSRKFLDRPSKHETAIRATAPRQSSILSERSQFLDQSTPSSPLQPSTLLSNATPHLPSQLREIGTMTHYLPKINVAIIKLTTSLVIGDHIYLPTDAGLYLQQVEEMQIDRCPVLRAQPGDHIGLKVTQSVLGEGKVFKVENF